MVERADGATGQGVAEPAAGPTVQEITVRFQGDGAGAGPLSWGQRDLWQIMREKDSWLPIGTILPLPAGTTVDDTVEDLRFVMSRYPSMRTRLRFGPDGPEQVVAEAGAIVLEIVDAADDVTDPFDVAEQVWWRFTGRDYDFTTEWPVRMAIIRHRGELTHRVWTMCHLATDGAGSRMIIDELAARAGAGATAGAPTATSPAETDQQPPLAQAHKQLSAAGQRISAASLRHWEKVLRRAPARMFTRDPSGAGPRYWQGRCTSPALHLATRAICERTGVESTSVLLAAFAIAVARGTGVNPVLVQITVDNRFRPGLARTASPVMQSGICAIEVPAMVDDAVRQARRCALTAYKNAYYDPERREELITRVNQERAEPVDLGCFFNDRRLKTRQQPAPLLRADEISSATGAHHFEWRRQQDRIRFDKLYVNVDDKPDTIQLGVLCDAYHVAPADVEAWLRDMEAVAVAAALDPAASTQAPAAPATRDDP